MRNNAVIGRHVNMVNCDHEECAELRRLRLEFIRNHQWIAVNIAERELAKCAVQQKDKWPS